MERSLLESIFQKHDQKMEELEKALLNIVSQIPITSESVPSPHMSNLETVQHSLPITPTTTPIVPHTNTSTLKVPSTSAVEVSPVSPISFPNAPSLSSQTSYPDKARPPIKFALFYEKQMPKCPLFLENVISVLGCQLKDVLNYHPFIEKPRFETYSLIIVLIESTRLSTSLKNLIQSLDQHNKLDSTYFYLDLSHQYYIENIQKDVQSFCYHYCRGKTPNFIPFDSHSIQTWQSQIISQFTQ